MEAVVIGLGSMGKRRIRLLRQNFGEVIIRGVDLSEDRRAQAADLFGIAVYSTIADALCSPCDCAFVCTAPLSHSAIILQCLSANLHVFSELNLVRDGYDENTRLAKEKHLTLFMSSTFLYREDVQFLVGKIQNYDSPLSYTYHVGQYLPDWHPWESHKDFFVGEKRTGGCREILAVELPWLLRAFGEITGTSVRNHSMTTLELPYPDTCFIRIEHKNGSVGQLLVDVATRVPVRHFEVFGESMQFEWRGKPEEVWEAKPDYSAMQRVVMKDGVLRESGYRDFIVEGAYGEEIRAFFEILKGRCKPVYTFEDDLRILQIIDGILGAEY